MAYQRSRRRAQVLHNDASRGFGYFDDTDGFNRRAGSRPDGRLSYIECAYTSLEQCRWSASGRGAMCFVNPYPGPKALMRPEQNSQRHRRNY
jgi:hypothetical protein